MRCGLWNYPIRPAAPRIAASYSESSVAGFTMFWDRRQPVTPNPLDSIFGRPEKDQREIVERMVQSGEWRQADADNAVRLSRRLEAFVKDPKRV